MVTPEPTADPLWYQDAVIYQLHIKAFADGTGDGIGDFDGLIGKLDYLAQLGVTAVWVLPFYPSPLRDDGYDIADYTTVNPVYGTLGGFKRFLREAHRRGLRVITELVINHTSDEHAWFQRARRAPKGSAERNVYVWSDTSTPYGEARVIFEDFETSNWTWDPVAGQYFWHRFYAHQPDLNFDNPAVHRAVFAAMDHWLAMGVDGVRLDAIPYLYEREGTNCENLPETHAFLKRLRARMDERFPGRMLLAEANQWPEDAVAYFGDGDECNMAFHFPLMPRLYMALEMEDSRPIVDILAQTPGIPSTCQWAMFLRNHDELTLEMVTDEERVDMRRAYAPDPRMRINLGIRRRLAPLLQNDRRRIELLNALLFSMPGTPVIYYGDEIGMGDNVYLPDRDGVRTPMQWTSDRNAGFSTANPHQLYLPVVTDPQYHYETVNVEAQRANPASLWWWMHDLIAMRRRHPVLGRGTMTVVESDNPRTLSFIRGSANDSERVLVVANMSRHAQQVDLDLSPAAAGAVLTPIELFGDTPFADIGHEPYRLTLAPYGCYWFRLEPARSGDGETLPPAVHVPIVGGTIDLSERAVRRTVEAALLAWMPTRPWFRPHDHRLRGVAVRNWAELGATRHNPAMLTIVEAQFSDGDQQRYVVPLAVVRGDDAEALATTMPSRVIAPLDGGGSAVLADGMVSAQFVRALALLAWRADPLTSTKLPLAVWRTRRRPRIDRDAPVAVLGPTDKSRSVSQVGDAVVELRRFLAGGVAQDPQLIEILAAAGFTDVIPAIARIDLAPPKAEACTLAVVRRAAVHDGDGRDVLRDRLRAYFDTVRASPDAPQPPIPIDPCAPLTDSGIEELYLAVGPSLDLAGLLGELAAELHDALRRADASTPIWFTGLYQRSLYQSMSGSLRTVTRQLRGSPAAIEPELVERAQLRIAELRRPKMRAIRTQIHGNLHLGRLLWDGTRFALLDVAGDLSQPVDARLIKRSPLRDIASLLLSLDEIAYEAAVEAAHRANAAPRAFANWAERWFVAMAAVLWHTYRARLQELAPSTGIVPDEPAEARLLLELYTLQGRCLAVVAAQPRGPDHVAQSVDALRRVIARL